MNHEPTQRPVRPFQISGTFLDEVTGDILTNNWGRAEWEAEFELYSELGIDTVILIRGGLAERLSHPSKAVSAVLPTTPVRFDYPELFLELAAKHGQRLFFGLYDSWKFWYRNDWRTEAKINEDYAREIWSRYGNHDAFAGWYLTHETGDTSLRVIDLHKAIGMAVKEIADLPVLASPYYLGRSDFTAGQSWRYGGVRTPSEHAEQWDEILDALSGLVDIVAFQDGTAYDTELAGYLQATREICDKHSVELWSNVETFERDYQIQFPPIDWRRLLNKIEIAGEHAQKAITFEFAHFMSPRSVWPSAGRLLDRYREWLAGEHNVLEQA